MEIRKVSEQVYVSTQITPEDLVELKKLGLRSVICNRPDGEEPGQPTYDQIAKAAKALGMETRFIPVSGGDVPRKDVAAFGEALREMPRPVLAYCRSGARSTLMWSLANESASLASGRRMN